MKPDVSKRHLTIFIRLSKNFGSLTCARGLFKIFNFPPKNLEKIHAPIFSINSASNICSNVVNFPAKKLRKNTGAQNTHAPFFLKIYLREILLSLCTIASNKSYLFACLVQYICPIKLTDFISSFVCDLYYL